MTPIERTHVIVFPRLHDWAGGTMHHHWPPVPPLAVVQSAFAAVATGVLAMVSPESIVAILSAIGVGLGVLFTALGRSWIDYKKKADEAYKESTLAKLDEAQRQRQRDVDDAKRERAALVKQIDSLSDQMSEQSRIIQELRTSLVVERTTSDRERSLANQWRSELTELTKTVLREAGFLQRPEVH